MRRRDVWAATAILASPRLASAAGVETRSARVGVLAFSGRRHSILRGRILNGTKPTDLPVEEFSSLRLMLNLKTARALGITIPRSPLLRADEFVQ